jgi:prophage regulatory protein
MKEYVSDVQLAKRYSVSRCTIWRWTAKGLLPKPVQLSDNCTRWRLDLIEQRDAERDGRAV